MIIHSQHFNFYQNFYFTNIRISNTKSFFTGHSNGCLFQKLNRILASHFETKQGADYSTTCGNPDDCQGELRQQVRE